MDNKPNYFVRFLIIILCTGLTSMVAYKFLKTQPQGVIDSGVFSVISVIVILVLSETFDNFSVGKITSITRTVRKQEKEIGGLERRNENLLAQVISISASQSQNQSHLNFYGDYHVATPAVTQATPEEVELKNESEVAASGASQSPESITQPARALINWRKAEELALNKYILRNRISAESVITEAKLTSQFDGVDPISTQAIIFDAFHNVGGIDVFVEFRPERGSPMYRDRLYVMLSKVNHYRQVKKVDAYLELVLMKVPDGESVGFPTSRLLENFAPAIASGLLRVMEVEFSADEHEQITGNR